MTALAETIESILKDYLANLKSLNTLNIDGGLFKLYSSDFGAITNLRIYNNGLITINIDYYKEEKQEPLLTYEVCIESAVQLSVTFFFCLFLQQSKQLEKKICVSLNCFRTKLFPPLKRGASFDVYLTSSGSIPRSRSSFFFRFRTPRLLLVFFCFFFCKKSTFPSMLCYVHCMRSLLL